MTAWYEEGKSVEIPAQVVDCMYAIAARNLAKKNVRKAQMQGIDFNPAAINVDETRIETIKDEYTQSSVTIR